MGMFDNFFSSSPTPAPEETEEEKQKRLLAEQATQGGAATTPGTPPMLPATPPQPLSMPKPVAPTPKSNDVDTISSHSNPDTASGRPDRNTLQETSVKEKISGTMPSAPTNDLKGKILPMILRFALPAIAGAAIGGRGQIGALAGGLGGLAAGGSGYLKDQARSDEDAQKQNKFSQEIGLKQRDVATRELRARKYQGGGARKPGDTDAKLLPQEDEYEFLARARNGEKVDPNDKASVNKFISQARAAYTANNKEYKPGDPAPWYMPGQFKNEDDLKASIGLYNDWIDNAPPIKGSRNRISIGDSPMQKRNPSPPPTQTRQKPSYTVE